MDVPLVWVGGRLKSDGVRWRREELAAGKGKAKEGSARGGGRDETLVASSPAPQSPLRHNNACKFASALSTSWAGNLHIPSKRLHESHDHNWEKIAIHFQWMHPVTHLTSIFSHIPPLLVMTVRTSLGKEICTSWGTNSKAELLLCYLYLLPHSCCLAICTSYLRGKV